MTFSPAFALFLFPAMILMLEAGRRLRRRRATTESNGTIEGAVFGLFGLLLAFTFSGAGARYDAHRALLTEEINDIGTAYLRLDLLPAQTQPEMRQLFRDYITSRLHLYSTVGLEVSPESTRLQAVIWKRSLETSSTTGANADAGKLLLPAINNMIDITSTRQNAFNMHPPVAVPLLLFLFSCVSAFMAGYGMKLGSGDWVYSIALAAAVTLTVYATLDIEYPRRGIIRLTDSDQGLIALRDSMK
jgi:hypothetical protein